MRNGSPSSATPAIRLQNVRKDYRVYSSISEQALDVFGLSPLRFWRRSEPRIFTALRGINLEIARGERVGIIGRNGAGKTTLLKLITGNFVPTEGEVEVNGDVQALMQTGLGFHGEFTGAENIRASLFYNGLSGADLEQAFDDVVSFCELGDFLHQPVKSYSLGMGARLQFATATAIKPDILIVDEVLGAGDAYFAAKSSERMKRLTSSGCTLLLVSHSNTQVLQFSNRVIWLEKGEFVGSGDPLEMINSYEEFIHRMSDARQGEGNGFEADRMVDIPEWILSRQYSEGAKGADWGGSGPLRTMQLLVVGEDGNPIDQIKTGQPFGVRAEIESDASGTFPCSCLFLIADEAGSAVIRAVQPQTDYILGPNERLTATAWFKLNPLGRGNYLVSCGLYRDFDFRNPARGHRYHILARAAKLRVNSDTADDSKIIVPAEWQFSSKPSLSIAIRQQS